MSANEIKQWTEVAMSAGIPCQPQMSGLPTGFASDTWKVRLIEEDFFRLMFETEDV